MLGLALPVLAEESLTLLVGYTDWWLAGHFLKGDEYKARLKEFVDRFEKVDADFLDKPEKTAKFAELATEFEGFRREVLLSNPLLDFDRLLLLKRGAKSPKRMLTETSKSPALTGVLTMDRRPLCCSVSAVLARLKAAKLPTTQWWKTPA